jgi:hypothetical protein
MIIQQPAANSYIVTTAKGRDVQVTFTSWGTVNVLVGTGTGYGRNYGSLTEAVAGYKAADVKAALDALAA